MQIYEEQRILILIFALLILKYLLEFTFKSGPVHMDLILSQLHLWLLKRLLRGASSSVTVTGHGSTKLWRLVAPKFGRSLLIEFTIVILGIRVKHTQKSTSNVFKFLFYGVSLFELSILPRPSLQSFFYDLNWLLLLLTLVSKVHFYFICFVLGFVHDLLEWTHSTFSPARHFHLAPASSTSGCILSSLS